jgi:hypothetical protein
MTGQQQFIATLVALNGELDAEKQKIIERRQILAGLVSRNSSPGTLQWTPGQQRLIADLVTRNSGMAGTGALTNTEQLITDLLARSAELNSRPYRPEERQKLLTDVHTLDFALEVDQKRLEGQQRVLTELIISSMGLNESTSQEMQTHEMAAINNSLTSLETQFSETQKTEEQVLSSDYEGLLRKARSLWSDISEQKRF